MREADFTTFGEFESLVDKHLTELHPGVFPKDAKQRLDYSKHFVIKDVSKDGSRKSAEDQLETPYLTEVMSRSVIKTFGTSRFFDEVFSPLAPLCPLVV